MPTADAPTTPPAHPIAHLLFADTPLDGGERDALGVSTFLKFGDRAGAVRRLNSAYSNPINESRVRLTAAATLRAWGEPVVSSEPMLGAVVEYPVESGVDYVAAYADGSARYLNYSGKAVIWDSPRTVDAVDAAVIGFLNASMGVLPHGRPMDRWSPGSSIRVTCLTLAGNLACTPDNLDARPAMSACINAAGGLMGRLIEIRQKRQ